MRVDGDAALAAAHRDVDDGGLDAHPAGQRLDLVEADVGVVADASLVRTARRAVLDAIPGQQLAPAIVAYERDRNLMDALGPLDPAQQRWIADSRHGRRGIDRGAEKCVGTLFAHQSLLFADSCLSSCAPGQGPRAPDVLSLDRRRRVRRSMVHGMDSTFLLWA